MKGNIIIRALSMVLALAILSLPVMVFGENDAADLGYTLKITVTDESGAPKDAFEIGEAIHVKLSLAYTGAGRAHIYGLQGEIKYDPYVIRNVSIAEKNEVKAHGTAGQINLVFLDMTGQGKSDAIIGNIGEAVFTAKSNGTVRLYGKNFIVTNKDATMRYIDDSNDVTIVVGTGVKDVTKDALRLDIEELERMLADCTVTDSTNPGIYYPDFWVTTQTAEALERAIERARLVLDNPEATVEEIESAVAELSLAARQFEDSKIYGPRRFSGGSSSFVTVTAVVKGENGKIAAGFEVQKCRINTSCTIRMEPDEGYETEYVYINGQQYPGSDIFTIPNVSRDTTVTVTFIKKPPFEDVARTDWFYAGVRYVYNEGLFKGTTENTFSPGTNMSRAMLATVLYRLEGQPAVEYTGAFADVKAGLWYTDAVEWAGKNSIVTGYGNGIFAPHDSITREQIAVMMHRYAKSLSVVSGAEKTDLKYADASEISGYAVEAIKWAVSKGIIKGNSETTINPKGIATRAEVATMLQRFSELIKK